MREGDTVNVFDRAVAAVAPVHAAKRAAARAALKIIDSGYGNYGANLTKKSLRGWEFYGGSAKEDIEDNMLKELFAGKLFCGQEGRKALKIYKQDLPIPQSDDADVDTDKAEAPYIVVRMTGGQIEDDDSPQTVDFSLIVCAYDTGLDREGWQDVANIKEDIIQRVCKAPYFGGAFTVLKPITWALQEDDTHPYYFGACTLTCTAPAMTQDEQLKEYL